MENGGKPRGIFMNANRLFTIQLTPIFSWILIDTNLDKFIHSKEDKNPIFLCSGGKKMGIIETSGRRRFLSRFLLKPIKLRLADSSEKKKN